MDYCAFSPKSKALLDEERWHMKSNFEFLGRYWLALAEIGKTAEPFVLPVKEPDVNYVLIIEAQERKIADLG
jgi:hypothetical protein